MKFNLFEKKRETFSESQSKELYVRLCNETYSQYPYSKNDKGDDMGLIQQVIGEYWKPRYLLDHKTKCAYEFMSEWECLMTVTGSDVDFSTLNDVSEEFRERARGGYAHYPTMIGEYSKNVAEVSWQINPDGMYFMDEDGFGMTSDEEVTLYGYIDRTGKPLIKFRKIKDFKELHTMREEAEKIASNNRQTTKKQEIMEVTDKKEIQKTQVFNVIILDRSGSMNHIRRAAVDGFNETLAGIKKAQEKFAETQDHFVSLVTFCGCETKHVFDKTPASATHPLAMEDYVPCCNTPLYDAMGFTLTAMRRHVQGMEDAIVVVTIITDGMENSSREYTRISIKKLVEQLRGEGWTFTYMGANQSSEEVAATLSIRNSRNFEYSEEGTFSTMQKDSNTRMNLFGKLWNMKKTEMNNCEPPMSAAERHARYKIMADEAFDEEERNS